VTRYTPNFAASDKGSSSVCSVQEIRQSGEDISAGRDLAGEHLNHR
jgi:hypothetical protein